MLARRMYDAIGHSPSWCGLRCNPSHSVMDYIVDLTFTLDGLFRTAVGGVSTNDAQTPIDIHVSSGRSDRIYRDIGRNRDSVV